MQIKTILLNALGIFFIISFVIDTARAEANYVVAISEWTGYPESVRGFKEAMRSAGLVEGKNIRYLSIKSGGDRQQQKLLLQRLDTSSIDLIYSLTTPGTILTKKYTPVTIPIVFSIVTYPADSGLIESFEYSGNNLVGTSNYVPIRHYVKLLKEMMPEVKRVAIFHRLGEPNSKIQATELKRAIKAKGIEVVVQEPINIQQVKQMALELVGRVELFISTTDTLMQSGGEEALVEVSLLHKIPILSSNKMGIEKGASFGPVADFFTLGHMAGHKAVKILTKGFKPYQLETELQTNPLVLVNHKSVHQLGIHIPDSIKSEVKWIEPKEK